MDVIGKFVIIAKHRKVHNKPTRRKFNEAQDLEKMIELATGYAKERGEDFLIVQVVTEVSKPNGKTRASRPARGALGATGEEG